MQYRLVVSAIFVAFIFNNIANADDDGFTSLFDGKTLDGWVQHGGSARYEVIDGTIVGTSVPKTPNSFLCTKKVYGDFELHVEFKVAAVKARQATSNKSPGEGNEDFVLRNDRR